MFFLTCPISPTDIHTKLDIGEGTPKNASNFYSLKLPILVSLKLSLDYSVYTIKRLTNLTTQNKTLQYTLNRDRPI